MNERIDAVLTYHTNPETCGVAKFNHRLARELGVPCLSLFCTDPRPSYPLISIKSTEMRHWTTAIHGYSRRDLFLHDAPVLDTVAKDAIYACSRVYAANAVIARHLRNIKPDVIECWCPSTIEGNPTRGAINVLTFGMAHKIQTGRYEKLKALLDATGEDYTVSVSTAVHEGNPWDEAAAVGDRLRPIFGYRLRILGYLADDALARELQDCTAVAMFFDPALRANNTTFHAAVDAHRMVVTNFDDDSPEWAGRFAWDIGMMIDWPTDEPRQVKYVGSKPSWRDLIDTIQGQPCAK